MALRALAIFSLLSGVFSVLLAGFWWDSAHHRLWVQWARGECGAVLVSQRGMICVLFDHQARVGQYVKQRGAGWHMARQSGSLDPVWSSLGDSPWNRLGFGYRSANAASQSQWFCPYWFLCLTTAAGPFLWLALHYRLGRQRRRRLAAGLCIHCGYDLRASSERCPECGMPMLIKSTGEATCAQSA